MVLTSSSPDSTPSALVPEAASATPSGATGDEAARGGVMLSVILAGDGPSADGTSCGLRSSRLWRWLRLLLLRRTSVSRCPLRRLSLLSQCRLRLRLLLRRSRLPPSREPYLSLLLRPQASRASRRPCRSRLLRPWQRPRGESWRTLGEPRSSCLLLLACALSCRWRSMSELEPTVLRGRLPPRLGTLPWGAAERSAPSKPCALSRCFRIFLSFLALQLHGQ